MKFLRTFGLTVCLAFTAGLVQAQSETEIVPQGDVSFSPLNPDRGDAAPQAGALWGDIRKDVGTGTLVKFKPDFSSPPHIHNITYRAIVIEGMVHNDDPNAEVMWMGPGSYWTQPAGQNHITSAGPEGATIFLEILSGPYKVMPSEQATETEESPINMAASNIVWLDSADVDWIVQGDAGADGAEIAFIWDTPEDGDVNGTLLKMPAAYSGTLASNGNALDVVVIEGQIKVSTDGGQTATLGTGSRVGSQGEARHMLSCEGEGECLIYVTSHGAYQLSADE